MRPLAVVIVLSICLAAVLARAQVASSEVDRRYEGSYRLRGELAAARQRVVDEIGAVVGEINPLFRTLLENRLAARQPIATRIVIAIPGGEAPGRAPHIRVRYESERVVSHESRAGYPTEITNEQGQRVQLTQLFRDGHLEQIFESERGRWYQVLTLSPDGRALTVATTITGERLPRPIRYELAYDRQAR